MSVTHHCGQKFNVKNGQSIFIDFFQSGWNKKTKFRIKKTKNTDLVFLMLNTAFLLKMNESTLQSNFSTSYDLNFYPPKSCFRI